MPQALTAHPMTPCPAVRSLTGEAWREGSGLVLAFRLLGDLPALAIPLEALGARTDGLWEHTCFEAFLGEEGDGYLEFNLSPSGHWAAYRFDSYRAGMEPLQIAPPRIEVVRGVDLLELRSEIALPPSGPIRLGLTAVIEAADGARSYWSLKHPPGQPDFHHAAGRVLTV